MSDIDSSAAPPSFPMSAGDGPHSYFHNSHLQKEATKGSRIKVEEVIDEKLDVKCFSSSPFCIADLGCSVGPNTFIAMRHILEAVERKYLSHHESRIPEFQIFFNDHSSNDFNTLFASLPADRRYFACGVPGSFYGRLFPEASVHFMHSCYALHWLSKVPEELSDENSAAWNGGRIHYSRDAPGGVTRAYAARFEKDMEMFLSARAKELVAGGIMVLIIPSFPDSQIPFAATFDILRAALMDMVKEGQISEAKFDSFNLPIYAPSPEEMRVLIERNEFLSTEIMELEYIDPASKNGSPVTGEECAMTIRAAVGGVVAQHFGSDILHEVFDRFSKKYAEFTDSMESIMREAIQLFIVVRRI